MILIILAGLILSVFVLSACLFANQGYGTVSKSDIPGLLQNPSKTIKTEVEKVKPENPESSEDYDKKKEEEGKKLSKDLQNNDKEADKQLRINEQCYLLTWLPELSSHNKLTTYAHFQAIDGPPYQIISILTETKNAKDILKITPAQKAVLVPQVRLFKVLTAKDGAESVKEFPFASNLNTTSADILMQPGRGQSSAALAGIKEFVLDFLGGTPVEADKYIKASLTLFFQNIASFLGDHNGISFTELIPYIGDLYDPNVMRLKAVVGWGNPGFSYSPMTPKMLNAIKSNRLVLDLSLVNHELDFNQDGSFSVKINYVARIEALMSVYDSNILVAEKTSKDIAKRRDFLNQNLVEITKQERTIKELDYLAGEGWQPTSAPNYHTDYLPKFNAVAARYNEQAERLEKYSKSDDFQSLSKEREKTPFTDQKRVSASPLTRDEKNAGREDLIGAKDRVLRTKLVLEMARNDLKDFEKRNRIGAYRRLMERIEEIGVYYVDISQEQIGIFQTNPDNKQVEKNTESSVSYRRSGAVAPTIKKWSGPGVGAGISPGGNVTETKSTGVDISSTSGAYTAVKVDSGEYRVFFFYLGALLEAALSALEENIGTKFKDIKYLVGDITIGTGNNQAMLVNLADVPISLQRFMVWFNEHVIKKDRQRYTFKEFIQDVIQDLVISALGDGCYEMIKQKGKVMAFPFSIPYADPYGTQSRVGDARRTNITAIQGARAQANDPEGLPQHKLENFFLIVGTNNDIDSKTLPKQSHFLSLGEDKGILKSIKFTKTDLKYFKESRIVDPARKDTVGGFIREPYNANIDMIGNTLFLPGQYVKINNFLPGGQDGNEIGLGGNFLVVNVKHVFSSANWESTAKAIWQNDGKSDIVRVVSDEVSPTENKSPQKEPPPVNQDGKELKGTIPLSTEPVKSPEDLGIKKTN